MYFKNVKNNRIDRILLRLKSVEKKNLSCFLLDFWVQIWIYSSNHLLHKVTECLPEAWHKLDVCVQWQERIPSFLEFMSHQVVD